MKRFRSMPPNARYIITTRMERCVFSVTILVIQMHTMSRIRLVVHLKTLISVSLRSTSPVMQTDTTIETVNDDYSQPRALFESFDESQKQRLFSNIAEAMQGVPSEIVQRQLGHFSQIHPFYALGVADALGLSMDISAAA